MQTTIQRETNIFQLNFEKKRELFDVLIIGGGINGAVCASALSAKGAKVGLIDKGDFGHQTSQESSNLVWGGIKYLQSLEISLVRKLCKSRNELLRAYPSRIKETRFLTMIEKTFRFHPFFIFMGTLVYWCLGSFFTKTPRFYSPHQLKLREVILNTEISNGGFEYSDAVLEESDSRFVFDFIKSAIDKGAHVANYIRAQSSKFQNNIWSTEVNDLISNENFTICSKMVINACGLHVDDYNQKCGLKTKHKHIFSKGVHLIVRQLITSSEKKVLTFFSDDDRPFFAIPLNDKTSVGTTDTPIEYKNLPPRVTEEDRKFILDNINKRLDLKRPLDKGDIIAERCGVRPLAVSVEPSKKGTNQNWLHLSRKHILEFNSSNGFVSIFGGKLTDCLNIAQEISKIVHSFKVPMPFYKRKWYGEILGKAKKEYEWQAYLLVKQELLPNKNWIENLWRRYGLGAFEILNLLRYESENKKIFFDDSQEHLNIEMNQYLRAEILYMSKNEMITNLSDFLRRRTNLALVYKKDMLQNHPDLLEISGLLFGKDKVSSQFTEYFHNQNE